MWSTLAGKWEEVGGGVRAGEGENGVCSESFYTYTHTHTRTHARTHTHTHAHTRLDPNRVGLVTCVAGIGAPAVDAEKLVSGDETTLALHTHQRVLASGVCEKGEGKEGNERVAVALQALPTGGQVWVANREDVAKIDISQPENIPLVRKKPW